MAIDDQTHGHPAAFPNSGHLQNHRIAPNQHLLRPTSQRIIVNINSLYKDRDFLAAMETNKASITGYTEGAGRYKGSQQEIVIAMDTISKSQIRSLGGHSSDLNELTQLAHISIYFQFGRLATPQELAHAARLVGPSWLSLAATRRVLERVDDYAEVLREVKRLQTQAGMSV